MDQIWQQLWNAGIPLFLLCFGIVVIWKQWRDDMKEAKEQREKSIDALSGLKTGMQTQADALTKLTTALEQFFLKHFP